jgi:hypothetical protein
MTFKLLDVVTATEAVPESGVRSGMTGVVVDVYQDGEVEVEFCDSRGATLALVPMRQSQLKASVPSKKAA